MNLLHTEASPGFGGQELRILREAEGMRARGHNVILAVQKGGGLVEPARLAGFQVYEVPFKKSKAIPVLYFLLRLIRKHRIEILNTHSSIDAWLGGIAGKLSGIKVIRTRHLSTPIRAGLNSRLLYNLLADHVVTTCAEVVPVIQTQAKLPTNRCLSIPTGVDPSSVIADPKEVAAFREKLGVAPDECLVGTTCVLRGWKGISDLLQAAKLLEHVPKLKWVIVGSGVSEAHFLNEWKTLGLEGKVHFTGYLAPPYVAMAAMDIFMLLSWANEGVSQATLQAGFLKKPFVTTPVGGLREVCIDGKTGLQVPPHSPQDVAKAVLQLFENKDLRLQMGEQSQKLILENFTLKHTLDQMELLYNL